MNVSWKVGAAALIAWTAGCVPLTDYRALERRYQEQEEYVEAHKDKVREMERNEQVLTLRAREQQRQMELVRARLQKSETLRKRLEEQLQTMSTSVPASAPKEEEAPPPAVAGLEVNPQTQGLVLESGLLFPSGKAILKREGKQILDRLVAELNAPDYRSSQIRVDGHTDDAPIKRSGHKSNWDLSAKRALTVLHYMESQGIASERLSFRGFAAHKPLDSGSSKAARAHNRRVEVVLFEE